MTSWRDSDDPRCPACGEKITATAQYCMHCEVDFAEDGSVIRDDPPVGTGGSQPAQSSSGSEEYTKPEDDFQLEAGESVDGEIDDDALPDEESGGESGWSADDSSSSSGSTGTTDSRGSAGDSESGSEYTDDQQEDVSESDDYPYDDEVSVDDARPGQDYEQTTVLVRGPVAIAMGFPAGILAVIAVLAVMSNISGTLFAAVFLLTWVGVAGYLLRKPLASDAIGDGFYIYGGLLLGIPLLFLVGQILSSLIALDFSGLGGTVIGVIFIELFLLFPAGFMLVIGYACNNYARKRIENALNERQTAV